MRALTGSGVSHQEKDGQSFLEKYVFYCGLLHFSVMVNVMVSVRQYFSSQSKRILGDLCE